MIGKDVVHEEPENPIDIQPDLDDDGIDTSEGYEACMDRFMPDITLAMATLRLFAAQRQP